MIKCFFILFFLLVSFQNKVLADINTNCIESFARLYGYVRWFHPSDEASEIDWNKFAVSGVQKVKNIRSTKDLKDTLLCLFSPIVPGIQINETGEFENTIPVSEGKIVAWQHYGVDLGIIDYSYKSIRTNITEIKDVRVAYKRNVDVDIEKVKGKNLKLSGFLKVKNTKQGNAAIHLDPTFYSLIRPNDINKVNITSTEWKKYELTMIVPDHAATIKYGIALSGDVEVWADNFQLLVEENGVWKTIEMTDFENGNFGKYPFEDWYPEASPYYVGITDQESYSGNYCLKAIYKGAMFENIPKAGEAIQEIIGESLYCYVPLTLNTMDGKSTFPKTNYDEFNRLKDELSKVQINRREFNVDVNISDVIVAWNVLQHFFPYMNDVDIDWEQELKKTINTTLGNQNQYGHMQTLEKMLAKLLDGHGRISGERRYYLPVNFDYIEDQIVVTLSTDSLLQKGDVIKKVDGMQAPQVLSELEQTISGSPQLKRFRAFEWLMFGTKYVEDKINFEIERNKETLQVTLTTDAYTTPYNDKSPYYGIIELEPGIFYVNISDDADFLLKIEELAKAKAVIYDFRYWGLKSSMFKIIPHLTSTSLRFPTYSIPQIIYPNRRGWFFNNQFNYINPQKPTFLSKNIFIINSTMVSAGETFMSFLDYYNLGVTVGSVTAGCNGEVNIFSLPCGYKVHFTGMQILKHDNSQLYLKGYEPDYHIFKTMEAFMTGKDLYLEKALEIARLSDNKM